MSDCNLQHCSGIPEHALDTPVQCAHCGASVPSSAAVMFEGVDYLRHFCGDHCIADWCAATQRRGSEA
jgi:hypothetical protein